MDEKKVIMEKCYQINLSKINEGYLYSEESCYAESLGKAKSELLSRLHYSNMRLKYPYDDELTFLNIPVIRYKVNQSLNT